MPNTTHMRIPSNRVRDIERYLMTELGGLYPEGELRMFVRLLFEAFLGWDTPQLLLHREDTVNQSDLLRFHWAVEDLRRFRPIQHIAGYTHFCDCRIEVSPDVLIPRPETEEIVQQAIRRLEGTLREEANLLDLCTGSGCIAISLALALRFSQVHAVDNSVAALAVARANARALKARVGFMMADVLLPCLEAESCDVLVSNPPYVCESERAQMEPHVLQYEPAEALFVPDADPLRFYRALAMHATTALAPGGRVYVEVNRRFADEVARLFQQAGLVDAATHRDSFGNLRFVTALRPAE